VLKYGGCSGSWSWRSSAVQQQSCAGRSGGAGAKPGRATLTSGAESMTGGRPLRRERVRP